MHFCSEELQAFLSMVPYASYVANHVKLTLARWRRQ